MKAIVVEAFGEPDVLKIKEIETPVPGAGQVLVRIHAAGVNPVDTYIRSGRYANMGKVPYTPGGDAGGVVEAVGEGVTRWKSGDRVYTASALTGSYAEYALVAEGNVHSLPDNITFAQGAGVNVPYATAYHALFNRAHALAGETVLVHGASGGVGSAAVQIAVAHGLTVIGTAGTDEGLALVKAEGAHHVFNHRKEGYLDEIRDVTGGQGVDVILEMLANVNLDNDLTLLASGGRVAIIGSRGRIEIDPRGTMARETSILGVMLYNATPAQLTQIHAALYAGLANGTLRPVVGQTFPLAEAAQAHIEILEPGTQGKIVLVP